MESVATAVSDIVERDSVVKSVQQVTDLANRSCDLQLKPWYTRKVLKGELHLGYK